MHIYIKKNNLLFTLLSIYMLTKMLWDKLVPNVLEVFSLCAVCYGIFMYFKSSHLRKKDLYLPLLFVIFAVYVLIDAFIKDNNQQFFRAVYEYIFYTMMMFGASYYLRKVDTGRFLKIINVLGIVIVVLSWYEYLTKSYLIGSFSGTTILYVNNSAFRAAVFSRSYLSHGVVVGFFSLISHYLFLKERKKSYFIQTIITYLTILTTSSRGPLVATGGAILLIYVINQYRESNRIDKKVLTWCTLFLIAMLIFFFLTSTFTTGNQTIDYFLYRMRKIIDWSGDAGNVGRIKLWNNALDWFKTDRLFGIGPSKTGSWGSGSLGVTESGLLKRLCELGIVGFSLYYFMVVTIIKNGVINYKKANKENKLIYILFFGVLAMVMINDVTLQSTEEIMVTFIYMIALGGMNIRISDTDNLEKETTSGSNLK